MKKQLAKYKQALKNNKLIQLTIIFVLHGIGLAILPLFKHQIFDRYSQKDRVEPINLPDRPLPRERH